jgi:hypothetical protein
MTGAEGARLRLAADPAEFDAAIQEVRARHAGERTDAAVEAGTMTRGEGDDILASTKRGEHSMSHRARLRQHLAPGKRSSDGPATEN